MKRVNVAPDNKLCKTLMDQRSAPRRSVYTQDTTITRDKQIGQTYESDWWSNINTPHFHTNPEDSNINDLSVGLSNGIH